MPPNFPARPRSTVIYTASPNGTTAPDHYPQSAFDEDRENGGDAEAKKGALKGRLTSAAQKLYQRWDEARKPYLGLTQTVWARYNNEWDWSEKQDWQSQRNIPKVTMTVERLVATMHRLLSMSKQWFAVKASHPKKEKYINFVKRRVKWRLDKIKFLKTLKRALKIGMISHIMPSMVSWEWQGIPFPEREAEAQPMPMPAMDLPEMPFGAPTGQKATVGRGQSDSFLRIENLNPHLILLDPSGRNRGKIIVRKYTPAEFRFEADVRGFINVDEVIAKKKANPETETIEVIQKEIGPLSASDDSIELWEFHLDYLPDENGENVMEGMDPERNFFFILASKGEDVVLPPTANPFWHGEDGIVAPGMIDKPFSVYHASPLSISIEAIELWVNYLNLMIDASVQAIIGIKEVDMDLLHVDEDEDSIRNLYPGRALKKKGQGQLISNMQVGEFPQFIPMFLQLLGSELSDGTAMKDAGEGQPRTRSRMSGIEQTARIADAGVLLDSMFESIQDEWISPILRMSFLNDLQFTPQDEWVEWCDIHAEKFPELAQDMEAIKAWTPQQRFDELGRDIEFETKVFSAVFDRQQEIESVTFLLGVVGRVPMAQVHIKWWRLLKRLIENLGYDAEEMISETPIIPYSEVVGGKPLPEQGATGGSDGGESVPSQPPGEGQMHGGFSALGGSGKADSTFTKMMPGTPKPGGRQ